MNLLKKNCLICDTCDAMSDGECTQDEYLELYINETNEYTPELSTCTAPEGESWPLDEICLYETDFIEFKKALQENLM